MNASVIRQIASGCLLLGTAACSLQIGYPKPSQATTSTATPAEPGSIPIPTATVPATPGLNATIQSVQDSRQSNSPFGSTTTLTLGFSGEVAFRARSVSAVRLIAAVDDRGNRLSSPSNLGPPNTLFRSGSISTTISGTIRLSGVAREAREIRYLDGEVDLFSPEGDAGSILIPRLLDHAGRPLNHPDLERLGIRVTYVDAASYPSIRSNYTLGQPVTDFTNQAVFFVQDPNNRLRSMALEDGVGRLITMQQRGGTSSQGNSLMQYGLGNPLPEDTRIRLELNLPEATKTHRFRIENVPLP